MPTGPVVLIVQPLYDQPSRAVLVCVPLTDNEMLLSHNIRPSTG